MTLFRNTMTNKKETFSPLKRNHVSLYVCGITPYDRSHIGHGRSYVSFEVLYRWLRFLGYNVTYCRNFTDIDDKLIAKADQEFRDKQRYTAIAKRYIDRYHDEMRALNCLNPDHEPRVTEHIPEIITFIEQLIHDGYAYESDGDVYFSIEQFPRYGVLSKQQVDALRVGVRVDVDDKKRDPLDFALWKKEDEGTFFKSPWGYGRPGWHIECSALALRYLGDTIDIHGGGRDLLFPHHENEIAQSESRSGKIFARWWMHNGLLRLNQEKMSKSLGNIIALEDIFKRYHPMELRYYFLTHHYGSPMDFSFEALDGASKSYKRLVAALAGVNASTLSRKEMQKIPLMVPLIAYLEDDLNTAALFGVIFEHLDTIRQDKQLAQAVKQLLQQVLGLTLEQLPPKKLEITAEVQQLIDERIKARERKDFKRADEIRDQLISLGIEVQDEKI